MSSEVESKIYECRAVGFPLPVEVIYESREPGIGVTILTDIMDGVKIRSFQEDGETVSVLRLHSDLRSIACRVTNGMGRMLTVTDFQRLAPINGMT